MSLDYTALGNKIPTSLEDFKQQYSEGKNPASKYYEELAKQLHDQGKTSEENYAKTAQNVTENKGLDGKFANEYSKNVAAEQDPPVDFSVGSDAWLEMQYELMKNDMAKRELSLDGTLSASDKNDIHADALETVGLPPEVFSSYTPTNELSKTDPQAADDLMDILTSGGKGLIDFINSGAAIDTVNNREGTVTPEYYEWLVDALTALSTVLAEAALGIVGKVVLDQMFDTILGSFGAGDDSATAEANAAAAFDAGVSDLQKEMEGAAGEQPQSWGEWMAAVWEATGDATWTGSPLVLDLDGDGIELVSLENTSVYWDIDQDGFAEATGWAAADDGFLAIDLNGDGIVTDHTELFGSITEDGFTALSVYDTNADGVIDVNDTQFGDLLVWQDVNQNGISEASELYTLADLDIVSINLNATTPYQMFIEGHNISHVSSFTVDDGVSGAQTFDIVDAWFQYDNINTNYVGDYTFDVASLFVTTIRGYGTLPDLHVSASIDNDTSDSNSLMSLLTQLKLTEFNNLFVDDGTVMDTVRNIMFRWAGVDGVDPLSRGGTVDARELEFIEAITGEPFLQGGTNPNPILLAAEAIDRAFETALYPIVGKLVAQAAGSYLFDGGIYYNPVFDTFEGFTAFNQDSLDALVVQSNDASIVTDKTAFWISVINTIDSSVGVANLPVNALAALEVTLVASDSTLSVQLLLDKIQWNIDDKLSWTPDGDFINGTSGDDVYQGGVGDDYYSATYGNDTLNGGIGNDTLYGGDGNDILDGQLGNDDVRGDGGDDTFLFNLGHGNDTIRDSSGTDKIIFGEGITANDLIFTRVGAYDLKISIDPNVGAGSVTIIDQFTNESIDLLEFNDGSTFDLNTLDHTYIGTAADETIYGVGAGYGGSGVDTIYGMDGDDTIDGSALYGGSSTTSENYLFGGLGNDTVYGDGGNDFLTGGLGDDSVQGKAGDDSYYFNYGDGDDIYYDLGGADKIVFDANITQDMLSLTRVSSNDVRIDIDAGLGGTILLQYQTNSIYAFETFEFSDGSNLNVASIDLNYYGTSGNDSLYGTSGNDVLHGLAGNDTFFGSTGNDIYHLGLGTDNVDDLNGGDDTYVYSGGMDDIYEAYGANDTLILDINTTINDISITGGSHSNLVIDSGVNEIQLTWFNWSGDYVIENIIFQDGFATSLGDYASWQHGTSADDTLNGTAGADTIIGKDGNDIISGLAGDDDIHGGAGNDTLYGGDGLDNIWGGAGADTFTFEGASAFNNVDVIGDFDIVEGDIINVADLISGYDPLTGAISDFVQITDDGTNSVLSVDANGGGDNFVQIATLNNVTGLTDEDALETSGNLIAA